MTEDTMPTTAQADWNKQPHGRAPEYGATPQTDTATEVRAGVTGHNVRYVLYFGLAGVVVAFALIYAAFFG
jgi:hypothetical protein